MKINIKKLTETATTPKRGTKYSAGYDLYADIAEPITIQPNSTVKIPTNISMEIPVGYFGAIYARSGLAIKHGLRPANCVGVIDADYRGNIIVALHNDKNEEYTIKVGERIAQIIIQPFLSIEFNVVDELNETIRGEGGFGSTGIK